MKRILSFFAAFSIAISLCVSSYAVEVTSFSSQVSMWDVFAHLISAGSDSVGDWGFLFQYLGAYASSSVCPVSEDNWHHGEVDSFVGVNEDGYTASCTCVYCGKSFTTVVEESDLNAAYSTYISTLPSTTVSSSDVTTSTATTYLYNGVELPALPFLDTYPYVVMYQSVNSSTGEVVAPYLYQFFCSESPIYLTTASNNGELVIYMEVPCSHYNYYLDGYTNSNGDTGWVQGITNKNWGGTYIKYCDFIWANHDVLNVDGTVYLAASDPVPVSSSSTSSTNDRFGLYMEELDEWNNTYGYDANEYAANYFISPDDGDSLYSPAVFSESTMTFTEPTTGLQYLCTDWLYYYDPDLSAWSSDGASFHEQYGMYLLEIADSSYYVDSTAVDVVGIMYVDDFIRIGTFARVFSSDGSYTYTMLSYQDYSYVMVSQTECGLNGHTYTYETVTEATCSTSGERKYTCSVCGDEYAEYIPATGNHTYKSSVTQEATCAAFGVMTYTCSTCGTEYTETIAPTGVHSYEYSVAVDPTCTADGTGLYTCFVCGDQYTETLPATGHSGTLIEYVSPEYDENGNLTVAGYSVYECTICGAQYTVSDEVTAEKEGFFSWLWNQFSKLIEFIFDGLASGIKYLLENIIGAITDWIIRIVNWAFGLFDGDALSSFFGWFSDDNEILNADFGVSSSTEVDVWAYS